MNITKAEAIIDGITIQHEFKHSPDSWIDSFDSMSYSLLQKLKSIDNTDECHVQFRIKPKTKSIQYRNWLFKLPDGYHVSCWYGDEVSTQTQVENKLYFVKWIGDTANMELEI